MGLFDRFRNLSPFQATINLVVKNAAKQYDNVQKMDESIREEEIASIIWHYRYGIAKLSDNSKIRWIKYMDAEFKIDNMVDFCLSSLDIEFLVDPMNELYDSVGSKIVEGLQREGIPSKIGDVQDFEDKWFMARLDR